MSTDEYEAPDEDDLASLLSTEDDSLAAGKLPSDVAHDPESGVRRDLAFLHTLRQTLRRPTAEETSEQGEGVPAEGFGRFQIRRELGRGGFGVVYLAHDPLLGREVALKLPRCEVLASPDWRRRFLREAKAAASLDHSGIVPVYEAGEFGPVCYLVSAYCPGITLADWLRQRSQPVPFGEAAVLTATLAEAVQYAHERGVVHRDLKPANILLSFSGGPQATGVVSCGSPLNDAIPRITDFGLAKLTADEPERDGPTRSGMILGTASYMAPEQAGGKSAAVGPPADTYALGVILYELLTGRAPFAGATDLEILLHVRSEEPVSPARLRLRLPRDLETICLKCLHKEPHRRYASARDLADDLRRFLVGKPIQARPVGRVEQLGRWCRRNPAVAGLTAVAALLLVLVAAVAAAGYLQTTAALRREEAARQDERQQLYFAQMPLALQAWRAGEMGRLYDLLEQNVPPPGERDRRGWEWYYLKARCHSLRKLCGQRLAIFAVAWGPKGRLLASASADGTVSLWDVASGQQLATLHHSTQQVRALAWGPDGRLASAGVEGTIRIWEAASGRLLQTIPGSGKGIVALAWHPDGHSLAAAGYDSRVRLWCAAPGEDFTGQEPAHTFMGHKGPVLALAWSPDGRQLASGGDDRVLRVWDVAERRLEFTLASHRGNVCSLAWSPDGRLLASSANDLVIKLWDVAARSLRHTLSGHFGVVGAAAWAPDGRTLASGSLDGTVRLWDPDTGAEKARLRGHRASVQAIAWSPDGGQVVSGSSDGSLVVLDTAREDEARTLAGHESLVWSVAWHPDQDRLASAGGDGKICIWDCAARRAQPGQAPGLILKGHEGAVWGVAWSRDGRFLASAGVDQTVRVWDAETGRQLRELRGHSRRVQAVAWSPDGRRLASASEDHTIGIWDLETEQPVHVLKGHRAWVRSVAWSPDGRRLASSAQDIRVWDPETGEELGVLAEHTASVQAVAWGPDSRHLASASFDGSVKIWDVPLAREVATLRGHSGSVAALAWAPDGKRLASGSGEIKLWDVATGQEAFTLNGHTSLVQALAWSPDGRRLASASWDHTVKVWDATLGYAPGP